jgi:cell division protein YceG involved in septum cleavage
VAVVRRPVGIKQDLPERTWLVVVLRCLVVAVAVFRAILPVVVIFVVVSMRGATPGRRESAVRVPREQQSKRVMQLLRQKMTVALLDVLQRIVNCVVVGAACYSQLLVVVCAS